MQPDHAPSSAGALGEQHGEPSAPEGARGIVPSEGLSDAPVESRPATLGDAPSEAPSDAPGETSSEVSSETSPEAQESPAAPAQAVAEEPVASVEPTAPVEAPAPVEPPAPPVIEVENLDWAAVRAAADPGAVRARMRAIVEQLEALLDRDGGPGFLFDEHRATAEDRAIRVAELDAGTPLWFIGDLHGDLLALEAALALIARSVAERGAPPARIVFLGDLFDDGAYGLEVLLRVFELVSGAPETMCVIAGNHDEALTYDGARFKSSVVPSDFADFLGAHLAHEWVVRAGKLAVRLFANAPRALFLPDGLLVAHGGIPLADLHPMLRTDGDWNEPRCLSDFVWTRAHPRARKKMPNRTSRGSQFGYEDFAAFCELATELGRPVSRMVRGHDHVEERFAMYSAYAAHPLLTTVALSRRLPRESFGPYERVPTIARWMSGSLPQVYRLHLPAEDIRELYPEESDVPTASEGNV